MQELPDEEEDYDDDMDMGEYDSDEDDDEEEEDSDVWRRQQEARKNTQRNAHAMYMVCTRPRWHFTSKFTAIVLSTIF